ncbi:LysR family transcriptional regulator [Tropicimonas sp. TH_r6]|uniref:LysR family transcriptional regulator n=1 Tax=Tropicimonas sp. TH_r6 TaxID=3082085 RepID=UPI002954C339|nr:LysR family transcriptional regulator [Tropicimonas sp. TH_r6]MDV7141665.1 LysR family transcriptional regulator [Tropicimonas sp. TH_r6]
MDWRSVKFDWNRARAFLVTAEEGSLSAAARALEMSQPTLGRQVTALEEELGLALFERSGRGLALTPAGLELLAHVRAMGEAASRVSIAATGQSQRIEGDICITASDIYAAYLLPPIIARVRREHPGIRIEIRASNDIADLRRREADIAIRNTRPEDPALIARKIRDDTARLYATSDYIATLPQPITQESLRVAQFVGFDHGPTYRDQLRAFGIALEAENFPLITADHVVQWQLVKQGLAIGVVPTSLGDTDPVVRRVLPELAPITFPIWLVAHRDLATARRIRAVFDILVDALSHG